MKGTGHVQKSWRGFVGWSGKEKEIDSEVAMPSQRGAVPLGYVNLKDTVLFQDLRPHLVEAKLNW